MLVLDVLTRKRERYLMHLANRAYVARMHEILRRFRGDLPQAHLAAMADVDQAYISRVEAGFTNGIGAEALTRILAVYKELYDSRHSRHCPWSEVCAEDSAQDVVGS